MRHIEEKLYLTPNDIQANSDSEAIQKAINEAVRQDIRRVVIPRENCRTGTDVWNLDAAISLPDEITVIIDGAELVCENAAFENVNACMPDSHWIGAEQNNLYLIGTNGAVIRCRNQTPSIRLNNVKKFRIDGIRFVGGSGVHLTYARHANLYRLQFCECTNGLVLGEGSRNLIVENIAGETEEELIKLRAGESTMMGRDPEIRDNILCRIRAKTSGKPTVALYAASAPIYNVVIRDITDEAEEGVSVLIGDSTDTAFIRDITVRGVDAKRTAVETVTACDGMYYTAIHTSGTAPLIVRREKNTRELLDNDETEIVLPQFRENKAEAPYLTPNDPGLFGKTDAETIQNAVDAAEAQGLNHVVIPRWNLRKGQPRWDIGAAIALPSNMTLELWNCHLRLEDFCYCNLLCNRDALSEKEHTLETEDRNITITGVGDCILDGGNHNGLLEKTARKNGFLTTKYNRLLRFFNVSGLTVENLFLTRTRHYGISFHSCRQCVVSNIDFYCRELVPNLDGVDIRSGCEHFLVENITGTLADDVVAMNTLGNDWKNNCVIGKEPHTHHITVRNVMADACRWYSVRLLNHDDICLQDIVIDTIVDASLTELKKQPQACVCLGCPEYFSDHPSKIGDLDRITIRDLYSRGERVIDLGGCSSNVSIHNCHSYGDGMYWIVDVRISANAEHFYGKGWFYRPEQKSLYLSGDHGVFKDPSTYRGVLFNFIEMKGHDIVFEDVFADKCKSIAWVIGDASIEIKNLQLEEHRDDLPAFFCTPNSSLIVNGETVPVADSIPASVLPLLTKWRFR